MFGPPGQVLTFSVAVRSFPTPAIFYWPDGLTQVGDTRVGGEITVVDVTVMMNNAASHVVSVENTQEENALSSQITIELKVRGNTRKHTASKKTYLRLFTYVCGIQPAFFISSKHSMPFIFLTCFRQTSTSNEPYSSVSLTPSHHRLVPDWS